MPTLMRPLPRPSKPLAITLTTAAGGIAAYLFSATLTSRYSTSTSTSPTSTTMASSSSWSTRPYTPRHASNPYTPADFTRSDPSPDNSFYRSPRFVTHIDDAAIASLREYYATVLPRKGRILDFCSSWVSHFPEEIEEAASRKDGVEVRVTGMGMNAAELQRNTLLEGGGRVVGDLNVRPDIAGILREEGLLIDAQETQGEEKWKQELFDAATNVVSTDYLTQPIEVLASLREVMKVGGTVHLTISNRCFPTKAIARWLRVDEEERLRMVGDFLHLAGWKQIEIVELSDGTSGGGGEAGSASQVGLQSLMKYMGMPSRDPLWVIRAVKEAD